MLVEVLAPGWRGAVALLTLLALCPSASSLAAAQDFLCRGHDPGWELRGRGGGQATFLPEKGAPRSLAGRSADLPAEGVVVWRGRPSAGDGSAELVAVMLKGACTDPAAGEVSTHSAVLSLPNASAMVGCCSYGPGAAALATSAAAPPPAPPAAASLIPQAAAASPPPRPTPPPPVPTPEAGPPARGPAGRAAVAPAVTKAEPTAAGKARPAARPGRAEQQPERQGLKAGARTTVAGPSRERVLVRLDPSERGRVAGSVRGGQAVVVGEAAPHGGRTWYRITGKGVPDRAWIRGDLLAGGAAQN